jgi:hypothetical protein
MPQQLADLKFFFHDLIVFKFKNKLQDTGSATQRRIGDVGSTLKLGNLFVASKKNHLDYQKIFALFYIIRFPNPL